MSRVTLKTIANILGVSIGTASKALSDYSDIGEETKVRVRELAKALNYSPNPFALSLLTNQTKIIGLIIPNIVHFFFSTVIEGVVHAAQRNGYSIIVMESSQSVEKEIEYLQDLVRKKVDGILLALSDKTVNFKPIKAIISEGTPVVLYDKITKSINCSKVIIDDYKAAFMATEYLINSGCKKIAHISGPLKPQTTIDRLKGYRKALESYKIPYNKSLVYVSENIEPIEDGYNLTELILKEHSDVDAIFTYTDIIAAGVLRKLNEREISVPDKISVIGFGNSLSSSITLPTITTVNQPGYKMGEKAFMLLHEELQMIKLNKAFTSQIIEIPTKLVLRYSTKSLPSKILG